MNQLGSTRLDPADHHPGRASSNRRALAVVTAAVALLVATSGTAIILLRQARPEPAAAISSADPIPLSGPKSIPALTFVDAEGKQLDLGAFRGKVVLLNVWATWCVPCREEMPTLDRLQAALGGPDFEVVALSIDRKGRPAVEDFFSKIGVKNLRTYLDQPGAAMRALAIVGVPTTLLIDREGREIGRLAGPAAWDSPATIAQIRRYLEPVSNARI
ncbi:TlpA disulfide reductase family protein [Microvirga sp. VF16]|uniref:TlpA family protein disulfide reductase n=1 Tax=Microvirga sp. VF16 TaxID=2807101 RepID=UPI00193D3BD7|nr:TlpA disulfide reductase family protein [Microvirga sp. VF16]QRM34686.1 TlpA family protein disulfide reductase [Microvirga sp. VF16]